MMIYHMSTFQKIYIIIYLTKQTLLWWNKKTWRLTVIVQVTKFLNTFVIKTKLRKWKLTNLDYHFIFLNYSPFLVWIRPSLFYFFDVSTIYQHDCDGIFRLYFYSVWTSLCFVCFHNCKGSSSNHSAYCKVLYYPVCFYVVFIWMVAIMCKIISNRHIQRFLLKNILTLINIFCFCLSYLLT